VTQLAFNDHHWREWEQYLRLASHAQAAYQAAHSPHTPPSLIPGLMARWERMSALAEGHRAAARALEDK
jgi:hypothetical protein